MELTKEEIASWYLSKDFQIDEKTILNCRFHKYAHVTRTICGHSYIYTIYRRILYETDQILLEMLYSFYDGYAGIFYTDKQVNKKESCFEQYGDVWLGRGFKFFLKHRALKYIDMVKKRKKIKVRYKKYLFDGDNVQISYY